jgi:uncharacterized membrane protein
MASKILRTLRAQRYTTTIPPFYKSWIRHWEEYKRVMYLCVCVCVYIYMHMYWYMCLGGGGRLRVVARLYVSWLLLKSKVWSVSLKRFLLLVCMYVIVVKIREGCRQRGRERSREKRERERERGEINKCQLPSISPYTSRAHHINFRTYQRMVLTWPTSPTCTVQGCPLGQGSTSKSLSPASSTLTNGRPTGKPFLHRPLTSDAWHSSRATPSWA